MSGEADRSGEEALRSAKLLFAPDIVGKVSSSDGLESNGKGLLKGRLASEATA